MWHVKFRKKKTGAVSNLRLDGGEYMIAAGFTKTGISWSIISYIDV